MSGDRKECQTCHWWARAIAAKDGRRVCVLHTGLKDTANRHIDFGGNKSLRTTAEFGCNRWSKDERPVEDIEE